MRCRQYIESDVLEEQEHVVVIVDAIFDAGDVLGVDIVFFFFNFDMVSASPMHSETDLE
jgi:hypothetical protein